MPDIPSMPHASDPPQDLALLDDWLRSRLDHPLTVVLLSPPTAASLNVETLLASAIAPHTELRLRVEHLPARSDTSSVRARPASRDASRDVSPDASSIERALLNVEALYPDILLVAHQPDAIASAGWPHTVLQVADRLGLSDRVVVALIGPGVTREHAHHLGFEDGYTLDTPTATLLRMIAREAVARDELRRHGSSPPCYL